MNVPKWVILSGRSCVEGARLRLRGGHLGLSNLHWMASDEVQVLLGRWSPRSVGLFPVGLGELPMVSLFLVFVVFLPPPPSTVVLEFATRVVGCQRSTGWVAIY